MTYDEKLREKARELFGELTPLKHSPVVQVRRNTHTTNLYNYSLEVPTTTEEHTGDSFTECFCECGNEHVRREEVYTERPLTEREREEIFKHKVEQLEQLAATLDATPREIADDVDLFPNINY